MDDWPFYPLALLNQCDIFPHIYLHVCIEVKKGCGKVMSPQGSEAGTLLKYESMHKKRHFLYKQEKSQKTNLGSDDIIDVKI